MMTSFVGFSAENIVSSYRQGDLFRIGLIAGTSAGVDKGTMLLGFQVCLPYVPVAIAAIAGSLNNQRWGYVTAAGISRFWSWRLAHDPHHLFSISVGREASVIWSLPFYSTNTDPRARRAELQFPLLTYVTRASTETTSRHVWSIAYDLGGRVAWLSQDVGPGTRNSHTEPVEFGLYFSASLRHRWFIWSPP